MSRSTAPRWAIAPLMLYLVAWSLASPWEGAATWGRLPSARRVLCPLEIAHALAESPGEPLHYAENSWTLTGINGKLRAWRWDPYHDGLLFDLVQVAIPGDSAWVALGVSLPGPGPDGRQDPAGRHYLSFTQGMNSHAEIEAAFRQPGRWLLELSVSGLYVSPAGVDWQSCQPGEAEFCRLNAMFQSLHPPTLDVLPGADNGLIAGFGMPSDPMEGFLIWHVKPVRQINLCEPLLDPRRLVSIP